MAEIPRYMGPISSALQPEADGQWVRYSDHQERVKELEEFVSAAKQWRNATESRLRMLDSRGEAAKAMLKADRDLIEALERVDGKLAADASEGQL